MALSHSPSVVTDGLVLYYDMSNTKKSWKGAPTTNLATSQTLVNHSLVTLPTFSDAPEKGDGWKKVIVTATSSNFRMLKMDVFSVAANSTTTYSIEFECNSPEVYLNIDGTGFGGGAWTKIGTTRYSRTVTTATAGFAYLFINSNNLNANVFYVIYYKEYQIENNSFATPYVNGTRSNTQALIDLTNNRTITANTLIYNADNTFSFNGSTTYLSAPNTGLFHGVGNFSYTVWAKWASLPALGTLFENGLYTDGILIRFQSNSIGIYAQFATTSYTSAIAFTPTIGQWYNLTLTRVGNVLYLYSNGTQIGTTAFGTSIDVQPSTNLLYIGMSQHTSPGQCFNGQISVASIYTRALSAAEVSQNFNALRGRYAL